MRASRLAVIALAVLVAAVVPGCFLAVPVRLEPVTIHKPDAQGNQLVTPNTPEPAAALASGAGSLLSWVGSAVGGPWGDIATLGGALLLGAGGYHAGHKRGKKITVKPASAA